VVRSSGRRAAQAGQLRRREDQAEYIIRQILTHREAGVDLRRQAVLFRASHHSMLLEAELARRDIPFHKYGGLKFVENRPRKRFTGILRLAENPRDIVAGGRVLPLLPGLGPGKARQLMSMLLDSGEIFRFGPIGNPLPQPPRYGPDWLAC